MKMNSMSLVVMFVLVIASIGMEKEGPLRMAEGRHLCIEILYRDPDCDNFKCHRQCDQKHPQQRKEEENAIKEEYAFVPIIVLLLCNLLVCNNVIFIPNKIALSLSLLSIHSSPILFYVYLLRFFFSFSLSLSLSLSLFI